MKHPEEVVRVNYPAFYYYNEYLAGLKKSLNPSKKWQVDDFTFRDGTPCVQVMISDASTETELNMMPRHKAVMPLWISSQFNKSLPEIVWGVGEVVNALKRTERGRRSLVSKIIAVCPYMELRQDKDGGKGSKRTVGEANLPEMYGRLLGNRTGDKKGIDELVLFGGHSYEAVASLRKAGIKVLPVTATPEFAEHIKSEVFKRDELFPRENLTRIDPKNTRIVALDKGSLHQNVYLSNLLGLNPADHIVAFDKTRKGQNMVADSSLIYGSMKDLRGKDIILYDDIVDTFDSMSKTIQTLKDKCKCKSITVLSTHGVLSHPARKNIMQYLLNNGSVNRYITTDSLPRANYLFEEADDRITIIKTAQTLGDITQMLCDTSYDYMMSPESPYQAHILDPVDKEEMWEYFKKKIGDPKKIQKLDA